MALYPHPSPVSAQDTFQILGANVRDQANGVLNLMAFTVVPDATASSLSFEKADSGNPGLELVQIGGGFTWSDELPLYLEGFAGYSRYDPKYVASNGTEERSIPAKWTNLAATGGLGWDFRISDHWVFRPILNVSLGHVASDAAVVGSIAGDGIGSDLAFLEDGRMNVGGLGGSVMLDYEYYLPDYEIDVEIRYTQIQLHTLGDSDAAVEGSARAQAVNVWSRLRIPSGFELLDRPVRYVLEATHSNFFGGQRESLGIEHLTQVGAGLELDSSALDILVTRTRLVGRYVFGDGVRGYSVGLAISF